jgi:protein-S-isoprenylcysteine O-methyltransferase Ste14
VPPLYLFIVLVVTSYVVGVMAPGRRWAGWPVVVAGCLIVSGGLALSAVGSRKFAVVGTNTLPFEDPTVLVTTGLYSRTRNPMYLGFLVALIGTAVAVGSPAAFVGPLVFFLIIDRWNIPFEEERLHAVFGKAYDGYVRRVRRWL